MYQTFTLDELESEVWKPIPDFDGYEASDLGRLSSFRNARRQQKGAPEYMENRKILKPYPDSKCRLSVWTTIRGARGFLFVHRAVLLAFVGPCPLGLECCHSPDPNPTNNRLSNLRWDTPLSNANDKVLHGTELRGIQKPNAKLTEDDVREIVRRSKEGESRLLLADEFHVSHQLIGYILKGQKWRHLQLV